MTDTNLNTPSALHAKLALVMAEVSRIPKAGFNDFHKYAYAMESDIVEAVRGKLAELKVTLVPMATSCVREATLTTLWVTFAFTDAESGETQSYPWVGTGDDKGDKGLYKAMTGALKYFLLKTFLMPTGDDPEADAGTDQRAAGVQQPARGRKASGPKPMPKGGTCWRCGGPMDHSRSDALCATCGRLKDERQATAASAGGTEAPPAVESVRAAKQSSTHAGSTLGQAAPPVSDVRQERNFAFGMMNLHGFATGEQGRAERLKLYARVLGRAAISEAEAKKLTPEEWRRIGDTVRRENEPPDGDPPRDEEMES